MVNQQHPCVRPQDPKAYNKMSDPTKPVADLQI